MAKMYSRGLQMALRGGKQSTIRFAVDELRRVVGEMRREPVEAEAVAECQREKCQVMAWAVESWATELEIVAKALVMGAGVPEERMMAALDGGFWDAPLPPPPPPVEDAEFGDPLATCTTYDGHDWRYVRESRDGLMRMFRCQVCGEEVVM